MAVLKNSVIVAFWTGASRGLGFARDLLVANKLGAGMASDAFFIALQLPNLLRRLLGEGAFNVAFVPLFAKEKAKNEAAALAFANAVLSWLLVVLAVLTVLGWLAMPWVVTAMVPGWVAGPNADPEKFLLTVALGRITFPYLMLICLAAFLGAVCNTYGKFAAYAMAPALLNISFIGGLLLFPPFGWEASFVAAWAVPVGGVMQLIFMLWAIHKVGIRLKLGLPQQHPSLKPLLLRMGPAALGVGVLQLSLLIDNFVASWVSEGAVSYLQYANRFYQLPLALIGIAVATVLLPHLAVLLGENNKKGASESFTATLVGCLTLATGATAGLFLLAPELMTTLLQHGKFTLDAAQATAWAMMAFVIGLPAYIMTKVTAPAFFASGDPMSPVKASALSLLLNVVLNIGFVLVFARLGWDSVSHVGIALATAMGGTLNAALQWHWLRQKGVLDIDMTPLKKALLRMLCVGAGMVLVLGALKVLMPFDPNASMVMQLAWLVMAGAAGGLTFVGLVQVSGLVDLKGFWRQFKTARKAKVDPTLKAALKASDAG